MTIPSSVSKFIPCAIELGFQFHHCMPDYVTLTQWIHATDESTLPLRPHHQIGVGGFVLNKQNQILVIQEKAGITAGMKDFWKLPGGLVDPGEDLMTAVEREVMEETGYVYLSQYIYTLHTSYINRFLTLYILTQTYKKLYYSIKCSFRAVASFRESHSPQFGGMTDFYCVCACVLDDKEYNGVQDPTPTPQEKEIAACKWMDVDEFFNLRFYKRPSLFSDILKHGYKTAQEVLQNPDNAVYDGGNGFGYRGDAKTRQGIFFAGKL